MPSSSVVRPICPQSRTVVGSPSASGSASGSDEPAVKLVLEERGNPVNPDDYGPGHSFMRYVADEKGLQWDLDEIHRRLDRQNGFGARLRRGRLVGGGLAAHSTVDAGM